MRIAKTGEKLEIIHKTVKREKKKPTRTNKRTNE